MVGGLAGERRLHRDRARDAAGTRLPGPTRAPAWGCGARGAAGPRAGAPQETLLSAPAGSVHHVCVGAGERTLLLLLLAIAAAASASSSSSSSPSPCGRRGSRRPGCPSRRRLGSDPGSSAERRPRRRRSPHLHTISMRPARGPPPPAPPLARLICMHIPRRHIPGLNPAAPAARCACRGAGPISAALSTAFRLLGKPQDFREERGGEAVFGRQGPSKPRRHKGSPAPPRTPGRSGRWESVKSRASARKRVSGASRAVSSPGPLQGARPSVGRPALRDLSLAAESEGGSRGPRAPRHACPGAPLRGRNSGQIRKATAPPLPPHPPPRPSSSSSSSSSAARGPEALHTGALRWTCTRPGASPLRPPAPREVPRPRPGKSPTRSPAEAQKVWASPLAGKRGGLAARLS
ncbi:uncharacterized protein [Delphinus delphis]|uniref:uncharacterized protein n=1 Tax=Delphinus delphis TaxID=9728 RepID=UPI003750FCDD